MFFLKYPLHIPTNPSSTNQNNQSKNQDGVEIFE